MTSTSSETHPPMRLGRGNWIYFEPAGMQFKRTNWSFKSEDKDFIKYDDIGKVDVAWTCFKGILKLSTSSGKTVSMSCSKKMLMDAAAYIHGKSKQEDKTKSLRQLPKQTKKKLEAKPHPTIGITDAGLMLKRAVNPCKSTATFVSWEHIVSARLEPTIFRSAEITIGTSILKTDVFQDEPTSLPKPAPKPGKKKKQKKKCCTSCFSCCFPSSKKKKPDTPEPPEPDPPPIEEPWGDVDDEYALGYKPAIVVYDEFVIGGRIKDLEEIYEILVPQIGNGVEQGEDGPLEITSQGRIVQLNEVRKNGINVHNSFCCGCWGWERIFLPWHALLTTQYCRMKCLKSGNMNVMAHNGGTYTLKKVKLADFDRITQEFTAQVESDRYWQAKVQAWGSGSPNGINFDKLGLTLDDVTTCSASKVFVPWNKVDGFQYQFGCFGGVAELVTWSSRKMTMASAMNSKKIWAVYDKIDALKYKTHSNVKYFNQRRNQRMSCSYSDSALKLVIPTGMFSSVVKEYDLNRLIEIVWKYRPGSQKKLKDLVFKFFVTKKDPNLEELVVFQLDKKEDAQALCEGIRECAKMRRISEPLVGSPTASGTSLSFEAAMAKVEMVEKKEEKMLQETFRALDKEVDKFSNAESGNSIFDKNKASAESGYSIFDKFKDKPSSPTISSEVTTTSTTYSSFSTEAPGAKLAAQLQKLEADIAKREPSPRPLIGRTAPKTEAPGSKLASELQKLEADIARREPSPSAMSHVSHASEASKAPSTADGGGMPGGLYGRNINRLNAIFEPKKDKTSTSDSTSKMSAVQERAARILNEVKGPDTKFSTDTKYSTLGLSSTSPGTGSPGGTPKITSPSSNSPDTSFSNSLARLAAHRGEVGK